MALDTSRLENIRYCANKVTARCPACAEQGTDRKGEHLFIEPNGKFGCVVQAGTFGHSHRQRIFQLVGIKTHQVNFQIRAPKTKQRDAEPLHKNLLGHLGRFMVTHALKETPKTTDSKTYNCVSSTVPDVPDSNQPPYTKSELALLSEITPEAIEIVDRVKRTFGATLVSVGNKS